MSLCHNRFDISTKVANGIIHVGSTGVFHASSRRSRADHCFSIREHSEVAVQQFASLTEESGICITCMQTTLLSHLAKSAKNGPSKNYSIAAISQKIIAAGIPTFRKPAP